MPLSSTVGLDLSRARYGAASTILRYWLVCASGPEHLILLLTDPKTVFGVLGLRDGSMGEIALPMISPRTHSGHEANTGVERTLKEIS